MGKHTKIEFLVRRLILLSFVAWAIPVSAQDRIVLQGKVIEEQTRDRTLISKPGWLRGVHIVGELAAANTPQLVSIVPPDWTLFCGKLTSIGGDYSATVEFSVGSAADKARLAELQFETELEFPMQATHENGGVVLEQGACTDTSPSDETRRFIASFWNQAPQPRFVKDHLQIVLNMNVARAERLEHKALIGTDKETMPVQCDKLVTSDALAFNYRCSIFIPTDQQPKLSDGPVTFIYSRYYRGRLSKPRQAEIFIGVNQ